MKKTLLLLLVLVVIASVALMLFWAATYSNAQLVQTAEVQLSSLHSSINTNGKIEADRMFELHAPFAGVCRGVRARAGDNLKAGEAILTIADPALRSDLASARAELEAATWDLQNIRRGPSREELNQAEAEISRLQNELESARKTLETNEWLLTRNAVSRFEVEQGRRGVDRLQEALAAAKTHRDDIKARYTEADLKRANSRVEAAKSKSQLLEGNIARSIVRAPVSGTLYHFEIKEGAYATAGESLGMFADLSRMRARALVDEPELGQITLGSSVIVRWDAHSDEVWRGKVAFIPSEVITRGTRSVAEVLCDIESPRGSLIPNVNADIEIVTAEGRKVATLPRGAVFLEGKDHYVWTISHDKATRHSIDVGRSTSSLVEVTGGIGVGDRVIVPGDTPIAEGMKVRVSPK
jgi:multidrug resistance efflux pump